jgi:hypothetical protein
MPSSADISWAGIRAVDIDAVWPHVAPMLKAVMAENDYDLPDIRKHLKERGMQLWCVFGHGIPKAACVTEVLGYPRRKVALVRLLAGGGLDSWLDLLPEVLEIWAKDMGCTRLRISGRRGWRRRLEPMGYRFLCETVEKEL